MFVAREPHTETITLSLDYGAALSPPGPLWSTRRLDTSTSLGRQAGVVRRTMEIFNRREGRRGVKKVPKDHASRLHSRHDPSGRYHPPPGAKGCNAKTVMSMYWTPLITVLSLTVESSTQKPQSGLSTALDDAEPYRQHGHAGARRASSWLVPHWQLAALSRHEDAVSQHGQSVVSVVPQLTVLATSGGRVRLLAACASHSTEQRSASAVRSPVPKS